MRLPNNYGSVTKLSGNRRKPYMVRITAEPEYDEEKEDYVIKRVVLGYYKTRKEALSALAQYNDNPFKITDNDLTFSQAYAIYLKSKEYDSLSASGKAARKSGYSHCKRLYDIRVKDLNKDMLIKVLDSVEHGSSTKNNVLIVMRIIVNYAYDRNIINKKCTDGITIEYSEPVYERIPFSESEIQKLWEMSEQWDVKILLILLYSGLRVNELLKNDRANVNLDERWIYVPKNLAKNKESERKVPIHDKIFTLVQYFYDLSAKYKHDKLMVNPNGSVITYNNFATRNLKKINTHFVQAHRFHDTRHTFASMGTAAGIPELYMQRIMGHTPSSILYATYTHISVDELHKYINMIK